MLIGIRAELRSFSSWRAQRGTTDWDSWLVPEEEGFEVVARMSDIAHDIETRRLALEPQRVHLRRMIASAQASSNLDDAALQFVRDAATYSPTSQFVARSAGDEPSVTATMWLAYVMRDLIAEYQEAATGSYAKRFNVTYGIHNTLLELDRMIDHIRLQWRLACASYEDAKLTLTSKTTSLLGA